MVTTTPHLSDVRIVGDMERFISGDWTLGSLRWGEGWCREPGHRRDIIDPTSRVSITCTGGKNGDDIEGGDDGSPTLLRSSDS